MTLTQSSAMFCSLFFLQEGDKVALVDPNGAGKSTLFQLLAGETKADVGDLVLKPALRFGYLPQVPNVPPEIVVQDFLRAAGGIGG